MQMPPVDEKYQIFDSGGKRKRSSYAEEFTIINSANYSPAFKLFVYAERDVD